MSGEIALSLSTHRLAYEGLPTPQQAYILVEAMPTELAPAAIQAVNFSLVLDRSGSMAGAKLDNLKAAARMVVDRLGPQDILSVVIFDETADIIVPATAVNDRDAIKAQIDRIQERGGTRMSSGMQAGLGQIQGAMSTGNVSRILLLTDGQTWEDQPTCGNLADQARGLGVPIHVMGLGVGEEGNWDPRFLEELAQRSGGEWYVIDTPDKVSAVFDKNLTSMQGTAVTNAQLTLRLANEVTVRNAWRVVPLISKLDHRALSDRDIQVFLGDIQHGSGQSVLVEVLLPSRQPGSYRLFQADIIYDVPANNLPQQKASGELVVTYTGDAAEAAQLNQRMMNIIERVVAHKLQTQALDEAAAGQMANATQRLRAAATRLLELGETDMAQNAMDQAQNMEQSGSMDQAAAQKMRFETKRLTENMPEDESAQRVEIPPETLAVVPPAEVPLAPSQSPEEISPAQPGQLSDENAQPPESIPPAD